MKNQIQVLKQTELCGRQFTVYGSTEQPLFLATELAQVLSMANVSDMISRVDEDERSKLNLGRQGETWFLTEDGLYEILMQSRKPIAKQFKKGVKEVLKTIRKHGAYMTAQTIEDALSDPDTLIKLATNLKEERVKRQLAETAVQEQKQQVQILEGTVDIQEEQIKALVPKGKYADEVLSSDDCLTFKQTAASLGLRSAQALAKILHDAKLIYKQSKQWLPYAHVVGKGYFKPRTVPYLKLDGTSGTRISTVITEKGRQYMHSLITVKA